MSIQKTILLVDDEEDFLWIVKEFLIIKGYSVLSTSSPLEAVQIADSYAGKINLLLTDVRMPKMSGVELSHKLLSIREQMPTLFMSGFEFEILSDGITLDELNFYIIRKPFLMKALMSKVNKILTTHIPQYITTFLLSFGETHSFIEQWVITGCQ